MTLTPSIRQAMCDGVHMGLREAVAQLFATCRMQHADPAQQQRTGDGLAIAADTAAEMLDQIKVLADA